MLDDRLTADERRALLYLLTTVALSDGKLSDSEVRFVQRVALPLGLEVGELLAHVDDVYAHVEADVIHRLAARLGVDAARLELLEGWVRREWQLLAEGRRLVEEP